MKRGGSRRRSGVRGRGGASPSNAAPRRASRGRGRSGASNYGRLVLAALLLFATGAAGLGWALLRTEGRLVERLRALLPGQSSTLVIPEGFTQYQVAERLEALEICRRAEFLAVTRDTERLRTWGIAGPSAEGYLFPATYTFLKDFPPERVAERLVREAQRRIQRAREKANPPGAPSLSEHELVTLASIVERETSWPEERPLVARVFLNRLASPEGDTRGRLQSDPTAAYGCLALPEQIPSCAGFTGVVRPEQLRDAQNPYNTYRIQGLPPGPIASPGEGSLRAVLDPAAGDYLYFVADGDGRHTFSRTFEEHRAAVEALRRRRP